MSGSAHVVRYDTSSDDDVILGTGMGCGGTVSILLEPADSVNVRLLMSALADCRTTGHSAILATVYGVTEPSSISPGERLRFHADGERIGQFSDSRFHILAMETIAHFPPSGKYGNVTWRVSMAEVRALIERLTPPTRLVVFGAGHDSTYISKLAVVLGWQVTVVDPRPAYATVERFPGIAAVRLAHPEEVVQLLESVQFDAAVIMNHNYHRDLALLRSLLPSSIGYVGLLGARSRVGKLLQDLARAGFSPSAQEREKLYAPVGLDIGAERPEAIALAIVAEIQKVLSGRSGHSLREQRHAAMIPPVACDRSEAR
jgi:xanthine/CO dehydrogenase XdhC/CoxF family maturation factor